MSPECRHAVRRFGHSGGQKKCVHDSDSFVARRMSERVSRDTRVHQRKPTRCVTAGGTRERETTAGFICDN